MINGSRLVYDREPGAMRFVNSVGNRIFARFLSAITGQRMTDTLWERRPYDAPTTP